MVEGKLFEPYVLGVVGGREASIAGKDPPCWYRMGDIVPRNETRLNTQVDRRKADTVRIHVGDAITW